MSDLPASTPEAVPAARPARARRTPLGCVGLLLRRSAQLAILLVLVTLMMLVGWLRSDDFRIRATRLAETLLEGKLGEEVTLTDLDVRFWPPGIEAEGFHVFAAGTDESIIAAERIRIPVVLRDGGVKIGQLFLQRPTIHLHLDEQNQLVEFRNLVRPPPDQRKPLTELPWGACASWTATSSSSTPTGTCSSRAWTSSRRTGR